MKHPLLSRRSIPFVSSSHRIEAVVFLFYVSWLKMPLLLSMESVLDITVLNCALSQPACWSSNVGIQNVTCLAEDDF